MTCTTCGRTVIARRDWDKAGLETRKQWRRAGYIRLEAGGMCGRCYEIKRTTGKDASAEVRGLTIAPDPVPQIDPPDGTWYRHAACRDRLELMYSSEVTDIAEALHLCATCPVRDRCLTTALGAREEFGIWGGTTGRQRRRTMRESA